MQHLQNNPALKALQEEIEQFQNTAALKAIQEEMEHFQNNPALKNVPGTDRTPSEQSGAEKRFRRRWSTFRTIQR
ncbi:hypothetical protein ACFS3C_08975 [Azotobacter vinelandii]